MKWNELKGQIWVLYQTRWMTEIDLEVLVFKLTNLSLLWLLWFDVLLKENQQFWPLIGWQVMFSYHTHLQKDQ